MKHINDTALTSDNTSAIIWTVLNIGSSGLPRPSGSQSSFSFACWTATATS